MKVKLNKTRELTSKDFNSDYVGEYEFNNVKMKNISEFYNVSDKDKDLLFKLEKGFKETSDKFKNKQLKVPEYLKEIEKLNELANSSKNIHIGMNHKNEFVISIKAELNVLYQTDKQLKSTPKVERKGLLALYAIVWEETERGWGTRPDGYSFHRSQDEATKFINEYQSKLPKEVPDEYSRPLSESARLIEVSESLYDYVTEFGSVWLAPNNDNAYKTYDANELRARKLKLK